MSQLYQTPAAGRNVEEILHSNLVTIVTWREREQERNDATTTAAAPAALLTSTTTNTTTLERTSRCDWALCPGVVNQAAPAPTATPQRPCSCPYCPGFIYPPAPAPTTATAASSLDTQAATTTLSPAPAPAHSWGCNCSDCAASFIATSAPSRASAHYPSDRPTYFRLLRTKIPWLQQHQDEETTWRAREAFFSTQNVNRHAGLLLIKTKEQGLPVPEQKGWEKILGF